MSVGDGIAVGLCLVGFWGFMCWAVYLVMNITDSAPAGTEDSATWRSKGL